MKSSQCTALFVVYLSAFSQTALAQAAKSPGKSLVVPMKTFTDPASGVSFTYPSNWNLSRKPSFYLQPQIVATDQLAQAIIFLRPGDIYANSDFGGLEFIYVAVPEPTQASCLERVTRNVNPGTRPDTVTSNGSQFFHIKSEDAGLCHQAKRDIYETYRKDSCLLFEAAFYTTCSDPDDGIRQLTADELKALSRQLDAIIHTVHISSNTTLKSGDAVATPIPR